MRALKLIDALLQIVIIAGSMVTAIITNNIFSLILIYIGLGIYQPLSFVVQLLTNDHLSVQRKRYGLGVLAYFVLLAVCHYPKFGGEQFIIVLFGIAAALLALYYLYISCMETFAPNNN